MAARPSLPSNRYGLTVVAAGVGVSAFVWARCPPRMAGYQRLMEVDRAARLDNQSRLRQLTREQADVRMFCAHDRVEFDLLAGAG